MTEETPKESAANACATCRSQKRKCDKRLPSCSRCANCRMDADCNYHWIHEEQQHNYSNGNNPSGPTTTLADFLLFYIPVTSHQHWLPGTFQPLQPCRQNISSRGQDIDHFFVGVLMTTLTEHGETLDRVLDTYFVSIYLWLPILHGRSFQGRVMQLSSNPQAETALLMLILFLLVGRRTPQGRLNSPPAGPRNWLNQLCNYLLSFLKLVRPPSLQLVQAGLLMAVYELGSSSLEAASLSLGTCARLGYSLRLNIDTPSYLPDMMWVEAEEKRRTWLGVYMLDRLIKQVSRENPVPHAVDDPSIEFCLPIEDQQWDQDLECPPRSLFQPSFSTPIDTPVSYFARETQAIRTLGHVQMLPKLAEPLLFHQQVENLDAFLIQFMEHLFDQTPGSWHVLCGANAAVLLYVSLNRRNKSVLTMSHPRAATALHRARLGFEARTDSPGSTPCEINQRSIFALRSIINMVTDICLRFNALDPELRGVCVPLPAVICIGEAARAAAWLNGLEVGRCNVAIEPLRQTLEYAAGSWGLAGKEVLGSRYEQPGPSAPKSLRGRRGVRVEGNILKRKFCIPLTALVG
ncbi:fungal-specific transcription factor domain-containing protein [Aspergillus pseudoustus]|uniref:Fungal-specific transcription factor domain-containing protein n=1 Tax=Aspergillus pseudoustus TaxID=1810923 RepID=A0ABR4JV39_9EURO